MKKFLIFTGNRAEFGLILPILDEIKKYKKKINFKLIVSGAHLSKKFGNTKNEITKLGYPNFFSANITASNKNKSYTPKSISSAIIKITKILLNYKPDALIVYADRFEGFSAVIAGSQMNIPTIHFEGGDITEGGVNDDSVRHAMTKLSHFHFPSNVDAYKRILKLGEEKWRVKNIGFTIIDDLKKKKFTSESELVKKYNLDKKKKIILFTLHPNPSSASETKNEIQNSFKAMKRMKDTNVFITYPNNDFGYRLIIDEIQKQKKVKNFYIYKSLGRFDYHGFLSLAKIGWNIIVAGNSSSGIKETTFFSCPTVNIGNRQASRLKGKNIINSNISEKDIFKKINFAFTKKFKKQCLSFYNPYDGNNSSKKFINFLLKTNFKNIKIIKKKMTIKFH